MQSIPPLHANRNVISNRANIGFIPATGLAPCELLSLTPELPAYTTLASEGQGRHTVNVLLQFDSDPEMQF